MMSTFAATLLIDIDLSRAGFDETSYTYDSVADILMYTILPAEAQQPQGFLPNRGQGQSGGPPLPVNETTSQKADRLHQLSAQQKGRI